MAEAGPDMVQSIVLIAVGGDGRAPAPKLPSLVPGALVIAADSGLHLLGEHGIVPHHVVGDLDSVDPVAVVDAQRRGAHVHAHQADKDATDLELALALAVELAGGGPGHQLVVVGRGGGRLDHLLSDVQLLGAPWLADFEVRAHLGTATVTVVRGPGRHRIVGPAHDQVSILPIAGPARGVTTEGLRWPLEGADLPLGTSRAVSNELLGTDAWVAVEDGVVLVVQPGTLAAPLAPRTGGYDPSPRLHEGGWP
jgi:thiamine pyrophosphokinase